MNCCLANYFKLMDTKTVVYGNFKSKEKIATACLRGQVGCYDSRGVCACADRPCRGPQLPEIRETLAKKTKDVQKLSSLEYWLKQIRLLWRVVTVYRLETYTHKCSRQLFLPPEAYRHFSDSWRYTITYRLMKTGYSTADSHKYCNMAPKSRNSGARAEVHC
jgi:hypothetical protein